MDKGLREENGTRIAKILDHIGGKDSRIEIEDDWELQIYYSLKEDNCTTIEMCAYSSYNGDALFDPLMRIELDTDENEKIKSAKVIYYLSRTIFGDQEIYSKGNPDCCSEKLLEQREGELDERLSQWLYTIDMRGYLTKGRVEPA